MARRSGAHEPAPGRALSPASSLARALTLFGDPWSALILKEAFLGVRRFGEFQQRLGIPRQTLSLRLSTLCDAQIFYKTALEAGRETMAYRLSPKGIDLYDFILAVWRWHVDLGDVRLVLPERLTHRSCARALTPTYVCMHCRDPVLPGTVRIERTTPAQFDPLPAARHARRNEALGGGAATQRAMSVAAIVGDRRSYAALDAVFRGHRHFDSIADATRMAPNVLSARLKQLVALGLLAARRSGRNVGYSATAKASGLYPILMSIHTWGDRWCSGQAGPPETRVHACGHLLRAAHVCSSCHEVVRVHQVEAEGVSGHP